MINRSPFFSLPRAQSPHIPSFAWLKLLLCCALCLTPGFASAQVGQRADGTLVIDPRSPDDFEFKIAIPSFEPLTPGAPLPDTKTIIEGIYLNLTLLSEFATPTSQANIERLRAQERPTGKINFAAWRAMGMQLLLIGRTSLTGDQIRTTVELHETDKESLVYRSEYKNFSNKSPRHLARYIANDVIKKVTFKDGLALTQIAYVGGQGSKSWKKEIHLMYADGGDVRKLTNENTTVAAPAWGMNGTEIYYTSWRRNNPDLYGVQIRGGAPWLISGQPQLNISPHWSQKNQRVVLTLAMDGNSEIYTMDRRGENKQRLTRTSAVDSSPNWSPDGRQIVFTSNRGYGQQLYIMDKDGWGMRRLTQMGTGYNYNDGGVWSPDGRKIAFSCRYRGRFEIAVVNAADGEGFQMLTNSAGHVSGSEGNQDPSWSPDGSRIVFTSEKTGVKQIWVMKANGKRQYPLTRSAYNLSPAWGDL